jgi:thymidylate synthase ThyX
MKNARDLITARILADSVSPEGVRMTTFEIEYPRFILAELNTHRMLSKNSASSRAIPVKTMHQHMAENPAQPVHWGKNQPGMQAKEELTTNDLADAKFMWQRAQQDAMHWAQQMAERVGLHKQVANRITEPWMIMKTVISGTEWANFWWLRAHADAQPEIHELAVKMFAVYNASTPQLLQPGEWHLPYVKSHRLSSGELIYLDATDTPITTEQARVISASCCAQVSYRKSDDSYAKAEKIFRQLIESQPCHASPVEHQATPMEPWAYETVQDDPQHLREYGYTHMTMDGELWSGNLRGWIQHRKLIAGEAQW